MCGRVAAFALVLGLLVSVVPAVGAQSGCYTPQEAAAHVGEYP